MSPLIVQLPTSRRCGSQVLCTVFAQGPELIVTHFLLGAHADIGGGSHGNDIPNSLSFIPLRWMIKECLLAGTGLLFDQDVLKSFGFDFKAFGESLSNDILRPLGLTLQQFGFDEMLGQASPASPMINGTVNSPISSPTLAGLSLPSFPLSAMSVGYNSLSLLSNTVSEIKKWVGQDVYLAVKHEQDIADCAAKVWDQLVLQQLWWALEVLPMLTTYQNPDGTWVRKRM